jgi:hypothetical protein
MHTYPFASRGRKTFKKLRAGQDYAIWVKPGITIEQVVTQISRPIIEIGGPTSSGYYFLDNIQLPSKPIITNISPSPTAMDSENPAAYIDHVVDGRKLPCENGSIGMFLMSGMSMTSDWYMELHETERDTHRLQIDKEYAVAKFELEQVALGLLEPQKVTYAQRILMYLEVYRALEPGGIFMTDGTLEEIISLQRIGYEILALTQEHIRQEQGWEGIYYEATAQKPKT